jgi:ribosome maturation factor RimP
MEVVEKLKEILGPILTAEQSELVDLQVKGGPGSKIVRIFVDKAGGITLDQCEAISRQLTDRLESEDIIPGSYRLEVSSPGVDRPLRTAADFRRNINRNVEIRFSEELDEPVVSGQVIDVSDETVTIVRGKHPLQISISNIIKAKVHLPW